MTSPHQNERPASGLDDAAHAAHAWARFRRMLLAMGTAAMAFALVVVACLWWTSGPLPWIFMGFIVLGIWGTIMMAALLMGLMFLSSGTGHDHSIEDRVSADVLEHHDD